MSQLNWTEAQWNRVNSAITEEFTKASVAGACLPCYGPVGASMEAVSKQVFKYEDKDAIIKISDDETTSFWTIRTFVHLNSQQVADENLSSALFAFKRAANLLARTEDYLVFVGHDARAKRPPRPLPRQTNDPPNAPTMILGVIANKEHSADGLLTHHNVAAQSILKPFDNIENPKHTVSDGEALVRKIADAIAELEDKGYPGPFACVLGRNLYLEALTPVPGSMVLPADRIAPMLGGPLLRSGSMPAAHGVVVSSCGESLDLVVATPPKAQFLQVNEDAKYVFRVYERFALRIKDPVAIIPINLNG